MNRAKSDQDLNTQDELRRQPIRRDGHQPIIFMQCGPIRHSAARPETAPAQLEIWPQYLPAPEIPTDSPIQEVFRLLINNHEHNCRIVHEHNCRIVDNVITAYREGRKILLLMPSWIILMIRLRDFSWPPVD